MPLLTALAVLSLPLDGATSVIVFGDSMSDTGNVRNATMGAQPNTDYYDGRFTNGPVWIEYFAARKGWPAADLRPSTAGGRNYAFGGAETGSGLSYLDTPNIGTQIGFFQDLNVPLTDEDLVVLWAGSNDLLFGDLSDPSALIGNMVGNMANNITTLMGEGAINFYVPNLPDLSTTPLGLSLADPGGLQALVWGYNMALEDALQALEGANPALSIERLDAFGILNSVVADPASEGFIDVTTPAYSGVSSGPPGQPVTGDPDTSLWWDTLHPTTRAHELLPEPSAALLMAIAALATLRRRR